jgi:prepilin signal peptidase PulO-like enzyme (type II secretory pathway)
MSGVEAAWWLMFFTAFGLVIGSFLNVVIYRLPRDLSLNEPRWSFCPSCGERIRWYDNLPVLSYIRLRGKCRNCRGPIALRYPIVEILTAITVVLLLDAFCIARTRAELSRDVIGITWQLSADWPIVLAHIVLFAALLAMSAIDIEHYWVDINFTTAATAAGFVLHAIWRPERFAGGSRVSPGWGAAALVTATVGIATAVLILLLRRREPLETAPEVPTDTLAPDPLVAVSPPDATLVPSPEAEAAHTLAVVEPPTLPQAVEAQPASELIITPGAEPAAEPAVETPPAAPSARFSFVRVLALMAGISLLLLLVGAWMEAVDIPSQLRPAVRWMPGLAVMMLIIVGSAATHRESDHAIVAAIEAERTSARGMVTWEALALLPAGVLGGVTLYYGMTCGNTQAMFAQFLGWTPGADWHPLQGLAEASLGFVIGAGTGWLVRILGTMSLGREAFGTGDIHMMAAAGCVAGWQVALIGFVLCSGLALAGWVLTLPFKRARAIPLGPWLSLAFLIVVIFYEPIIRTWPIENIVFLFQRPALENLTGGSF